MSVFNEPFIITIRRVFSFIFKLFQTGRRHSSDFYEDERRNLYIFRSRNQTLSAYIFTIVENSYNEIMN